MWHKSVGDENFIDITPIEVRFGDLVVDACAMGEYNIETKKHDTLYYKKVQSIITVITNKTQYIFYECKKVPLQPIRVYFSEKYKYNNSKVYSLRKIIKIRELESGKNIHVKSWWGRNWGWVLLIVFVFIGAGTV